MNGGQESPVHRNFEERLAIYQTKRAAKRFIKFAAFVLLIQLSYALGYLSATSSKAPHSPSSRIDQNALSDKTGSATTAANTAIAGALDHFNFTTRCAEPVPSKFVRQTILDRVFNGKSPYDNFPPVHVIPLLRVGRIKEWGSYGAVFENLIRKFQPKTIIEVGTFLGASTIHMAELASELGLKTQIICVDDFRGWPGFRDRFKDIKMVNGDVLLLYQFMQNVVHVNVTESVLFVPFSTRSSLRMLCKLGVFGDLIEIDAGHDFHSAWSDINQAYKILRPGGVIFGHDYFNGADNKGVRRAVHLFARVNSLQVRVDGQHWVIQSGHV